MMCFLSQCNWTPRRRGLA